MADESQKEYEVIDALEGKFKAFGASQEKILADIEAYKKSLASIHAQQDKIAEAKRSQDKEIRELKSNLRDLEKQQLITQHQRDLYQKKLAESAVSLKTVNEIMPKTGSFFLWLLLGRVNVLIDKYGDRHFYKGQYEQFKLRITMGVIPISLLMILFPWRPLDFFFNAFMSYYYLTLMIREHILKVNGSNIQRWWTFHHFLSMVLTALLLTWPATPYYWDFRTPMTYFTFYLSVVQLLQILYQIDRLYALRAIGRASVLDVADSDTGYVLWTPSLQLLLPFLLVAYVAQLYLGTVLFGLFQAGAEWQTIVLGALFVVLGCGNMFVTVRVFVRKIIERSRKKA